MWTLVLFMIGIILLPLSLWSQQPVPLKKVFVYNWLSRSCDGYNHFLSECFENSKIRRLSGNFEELNLNGSKMNFMNMSQSTFKDLKMNAASLNLATLSGVRANRLFAQYAQMVGVSVSISEVRNFSFYKSDFSGSKISNTLFEAGDFDEVVFTDAMITDTVFRHVRLPKTILTEAQLINVQFDHVVWVDPKHK